MRVDVHGHIQLTVGQLTHSGIEPLEGPGDGHGDKGTAGGQQKGADAHTNDQNPKNRCGIGCILRHRHNAQHNITRIANGGGAAVVLGSVARIKHGVGVFLIEDGIAHVGGVTGVGGVGVHNGLIGMVDDPAVQIIHGHIACIAHRYIAQLFLDVADVQIQAHNAHQGAVGVDGAGDADGIAVGAGKHFRNDGFLLGTHQSIPGTG